MNLLWTLTWGPHPTSECGQLLCLQAPVIRVLLVGLPQREGDPETHIYSRKTDLPRCSSHWTLWLAAQVFPFFNAMEGRGAPSFPHPSRYPAPFADLWALPLCWVLEEGFSSWLGGVFSHQGPAVTPNKRTPVDSVLWGAAEFPPTRRSLRGCQPGGDAPSPPHAAYCSQALLPHGPRAPPNKALCPHLRPVSCGALC